MNQPTQRRTRRRRKSPTLPELGQAKHRWHSTGARLQAARGRRTSSSIASFSRRRRSNLPLTARSLPTGTPKRREAGHKMLGHLNEVETPLRLKMNSTRRRNLQLSLDTLSLALSRFLARTTRNSRTSLNRRRHFSPTLFVLVVLTAWCSLLSKRAFRTARMRKLDHIH